MAVTDSVIIECGSLGKYQIWQIFLQTLLTMAACQQFMIVNFHNFEPKHWCALPGWPNSTNQSILMHMNITSDSDGICSMNGTKCTEFSYSKARYRGETLVTTFNLVCDNRSISTISTTLFTCSLMIGAIVGGVIADRIGRKRAAVVEYLIATAASTALIFTQNMYMYVALRGVIGACLCGSFMALASLGIEMTGPSQRTTFTAIRSPVWSIGVMSLSMIAYFLPSWNHMQIVITIFTGISTIMALLFMKESPQYLVAKRQYEDAEEIFRTMARINGKIINEKIFDRLREHEAAGTENVKDILQAKTLLKRAVIFFYLWFIAGLSTYGLSFNVKNMTGSILVNTVLMEGIGLVRPFCVIVSKYFGRKSVTVFHLFLGCAVLFTAAMLAIFTDINDSTTSTVILVVSVIGKYAIEIVFIFNYLWCTEIFPTTLRASLSGTASMFARMGSVFSPMVVDLYKYVDTELKSGLGPLLFGICLGLGGILAFFLPETNNCRIPETIKEANRFLTKGHELEFKVVKKVKSDDSEGDEKFASDSNLATITKM